jgi:hypothetical protein
MEKAFITKPIPNFETIPVMYQGASDDFLGPCDDVRLPSETTESTLKASLVSYSPKRPWALTLSGRSFYPPGGSNQRLELA